VLHQGRNALRAAAANAALAILLTLLPGHFTLSHGLKLQSTSGLSAGHCSAPLGTLGPVVLSGLADPAVELTVLLLGDVTHFAVHPASRQTMQQAVCKVHNAAFKTLQQLLAGRLLCSRCFGKCILSDYHGMQQHNH
jgi:hypothetical protein